MRMGSACMRSDRPSFCILHEINLFKRAFNSKSTYFLDLLCDNKDLPKGKSDKPN